MADSKATVVGTRAYTPEELIAAGRRMLRTRVRTTMRMGAKYGATRRLIAAHEHQLKGLVDEEMKRREGPPYNIEARYSDVELAHMGMKQVVIDQKKAIMARKYAERRRLHRA